MNVVRTRLHVADDGSITGHVSDGLPAGDHDAEILVSVVPNPAPMLPESEMIARIKEIQERVARMPILDHRSADEILGYNENGTFD